MAQYKVIQDIEAEDKLLGPLSLRQFLYAVIVVVLGFVAFQLGRINFLLAFPFLPPMVLFGLLAAPFGSNQSSEIWLLAKIRFALKPRKRIWNQDGIQELVTITAPKKIERQLTDNLSQTEVKSRLQALANTLDSRGWAVKNVNLNLYEQPSYLTTIQDSSDRLVDTTSLPSTTPAFDIQATDDILDAGSNPRAQQLDSLITKAEQSHRQAIEQSLKNPSSGPQPANYWFMSQTQVPQNMQPGYGMFQDNPVVTPGSSAAQDNQQPDNDDESRTVLDKIKQAKATSGIAYGNTKVIDPRGDKAKEVGAKKAQAASPTSINPDILRLANNDDLNVSTIAREANKSKQSGDDEVVISLH